MEPLSQSDLYRIAHGATYNADSTAGFLLSEISFNLQLGEDSDLGSIRLKVREILSQERIANWALVTAGQAS